MKDSTSTYTSLSDQNINVAFQGTSGSIFLACLCMTVKGLAIF